MNMIESAAEAAFVADWPKDSWTRFGNEDYVKNRYRSIARAVISAMREPTDLMKQAVDTAENGMGVRHAAYEQIDWETAWKAAIDAALKEAPNAHD